nr:PREDICTED: uncharacterized protein LOC109036465 isoform X3 [Bemisia tabaci]
MHHSGSLSSKFQYQQATETVHYERSEIRQKLQHAKFGYKLREVKSGTGTFSIQKTRKGLDASFLWVNLRSRSQKFITHSPLKNTMLLILVSAPDRGDLLRVPEAAGPAIPPPLLRVPGPGERAVRPPAAAEHLFLPGQPCALPGQGLRGPLRGRAQSDRDARLRGLRDGRLVEPHRPGREHGPQAGRLVQRCLRDRGLQRLRKRLQVLPPPGQDPAGKRQR